MRPGVSSSRSVVLVKRGQSARIAPLFPCFRSSPIVDPLRSHFSCLCHAVGTRREIWPSKRRTAGPTACLCQLAWYSRLAPSPGTGFAILFGLDAFFFYAGFFLASVLRDSRYSFDEFFPSKETWFQIDLKGCNRGAVLRRKVTDSPLTAFLCDYTPACV